jgi:release factor glutamine methyltransferase
MPMVSSLLKRAENFLESRKIPQARPDAEWILAHLLHCRRCDLRVCLREKVDRSILSPFLSLVRRRGNHEPLQYILGESDFYNVSLRIDSRALIPRPETEELVEWLANTWKERSPGCILDLGTGSGAIGIALAKAFPKSEVMAVDIDADALELAQENALGNQIANISFVQSDWFENVRGCFDLIVANPPYLSSEEWESAEPEVRNYEPVRALCSGMEGAADLLAILRSAKLFMTSGATLALEIGIGYGDLLKAEALKLGFFPVWVRRDLFGCPRFLIAGK